MKLIFEWNAGKAKENLRKHRISFEEAKSVFKDPLLLTFQDEYHSEDEERFISIGSSYREKILLVVHTERNEGEDTIIIRIIRCRKATSSERKRYEEEN